MPKELTHEEVERIAERSIQDIKPEDVTSPALRRLIEDIQSEEELAPTTGYNRMHTRHNRGR